MRAQISFFIDWSRELYFVSSLPVPNNDGASRVPCPKPMIVVFLRTLSGLSRVLFRGLLYVEALLYFCVDVMLIVAGSAANITGLCHLMLPVLQMKGSNQKFLNPKP